MSEGTFMPGQALTQTLGRYHLLKRIGRGGMGDVWLAEDPRLNRQVAIKTLPLQNQGNQEFSQRFEREAQAAAALSHPHILPIHDFGEQQLPNSSVITYIVMPYVSGGSLAEKIEAYQRNQQLMPAQEALSYLSQAAEAIDFAHSRGIVHRDIKPANMLLRNDGWLLLTDFGIARILSGYEQKLTQQGVGFGTPEYMAPEQAQGHAEPASDNYSLAVLAYQLFTGRLPFSADSSYATTMQHLMMPPPAPRSFNPNISPTFEQALLQGLAKQPGQRPISAHLFVSNLQQSLSQASFENTFMPSGALPTLPRQEQFVNTTGSGTFMAPPPPSPPSTTPVAPPISRRNVLIGGGSAALVLAGAGIWAMSRGKTPTSSVTQGKGTGSSQATTGSQTNPKSNSGSSGGSAPIVIQGKHNKPIATLAWSPKQNLLISAGGKDEGNIYLWDVATLTQQGQTPKEKASLKAENVEDMLIAWAPTGDMVAIANAATGTNAIGSAQFILYKSDFSDYALGLNAAISMDGTTSFDGLAWGTNYFYTVHHPFNLSKIDLNAKDQLLIWDPKQPQKPLATLAIDNLFMTTDDNISKTSDGKYINIANNPLILRAQGGNTERITFGTHDGILMGDVTLAGTQAQWKKVGLFTFDETDRYAPAAVGAIAWGNFGQHLAAIQQCLDQPKVVKVFDFATHTYQQLSQHPNATGGITTIAWNPTAGSQILAAGNEDGTIDIWDYSAAKLPKTTINPPSGISGIVKSLAWSADGAWLAAAYSDINASLVIWKM